MGSLWDLGLKKDDEGVTKKGKAPLGKVDLHRYGILCIVLAMVIAAILVLIMATGQMGGIELLPLLLAALVGPAFLAVIGVMLLRLAQPRG